MHITNLLRSRAHLLLMMLLLELAAISLHLAVVYCQTNSMAQRQRETPAEMFCISMLAIPLLMMYGHVPPLPASRGKEAAYGFTTTWKKTWLITRFFSCDIHELPFYLFYLHFGLSVMSIHLLSNYHVDDWSDYTSHFFIVPQVVYPLGAFLSLLGFTILTHPKLSRSIQTLDR